MDAFEAVIARYEEDVSWARRLRIPFVVYNKGESETGLEGEHRVVRRPNVGRESDTYLSHIIEHYDSLPGHLILLQGNPFDHCHGAIETINSLSETSGLVPLGGNFKHETLSASYNWPGFAQELRSLALVMGMAESASVIYATGAQYAVPRQAIRAREKSFYEMLLSRVNYSINPLEGWAMERLWPYLFGAQNKTDEFALDIVSLPGTPSCAEALPQVQIQMPNMAIFQHQATSLEGARAWIEKNGQDLVCIIGSDAPHVPDTLAKLVDLYFKYKYTILKEDDPVLMAPGIFLTHAGLLKQHWKAGESLPDNAALRAGGVPVFVPAI